MPCDDHTRDRFDAVVECNRSICREHFLLRLRMPREPVPFPATRPGQFIQLGCRTPAGVSPSDDVIGASVDWQPGEMPTLTQPELCGPLALLRRPFSLAGRGDDDNGTWIEIIHRVVGVGTAWLADLQPGDGVDLIGPLGNTFELPDDKSIGLLVGGGVGLPPMFYLAESMQAAGWQATAFVGALSRDLIAVTLRDDARPDAQGTPVRAAEEFHRCGYDTVVTTDDGSLGLKGRITEGLSRFLNSQSPSDRAKTVIFTCGPEPMMHAVADLAAAHDIACQVCVEQAMACGMGTCQSCVVRIEDRDKPQAETAEGRPWRYRLACNDGPVFAAPVVVW